jgi:hypothetical protein
MKRYGNLFDKIVDLDNIILAHENARKRKTKYKEVKEVDKDVVGYCKKIQKMLLDKSFKSSEYTMFVKHDKGKDREIFKLPYFPDRIIQHAIMQIVEPIWKKSLIADTYQAIKGRGVHKCLKKVKKAVHKDKMTHCLQIDIQKYYPSINNEMLKQVVRKKIKCKETLWVLDEIIDGHAGVPIGNYISQYLGNMYVSELDHLMKEEYKVKHYYRYCDDILIVSTSKTELHKLHKDIVNWLLGKKLKVKKDYQVYKITKKRPVNCLGYLVTPSKVKVRKNILNKLYKAIKDKDYKGLPSYYGWFKHCSYVLILKEDIWKLNK